jgi:hypothetical protein
MTNRLSLRRILAAAPLWVLAGMLIGPARSRAEEPTAHHRRMENRFLFVIDTSSAMKSRTNGLVEAVTELLASGMKGELRKGDTIGLWTYSDTLSSDFPMQVWSEKKKDDIVNDVREHLRILVYENRAHLEKAWPAIHQVVANSERLTIFLIYDGAEAIKGTPFDRDINNLQKQYAREFRSAHEPFVTVLAARDGTIFDYTINHPGMVVVPHMADPLPPPETNEPPPVAATPPPLEIATPPPHRIEINLSGADFPHHTSPPPPAASAVVAEATPAPAPAPAVVTNAPPPAQAAPIAVQAAQTTAAVNTNVTPLEAAPAPPPAASTPIPAPIAPIVTAPAKPVPVALAPPSTPAVVAQVPAAAVVPAPVAPAVVAASGLQQVAMFIIAFSLLIIAVALVVLLVWRWRGRSQPSLISRSIDRSQ